MRAIVGLDESIRARMIHPNNPDDNFDYLKIECRAKDKQHQHEAFSEQLFKIMKSVR
jgi:hypothetical protein